IETKIKFLKLISPFAPHLADELYFKLTGEKFIITKEWPKYNIQDTIDEYVTIVVEINGKVKEKLKIHTDAKEEEVFSQATRLDKIKQILNGKKIKKFYYVKNKLINIVTE
ncbi:MAG: class I tRNA ligase family protein, partial [bacterium]|nr:class I tRNA ligase family protein [bacterium]